MGLRVAKQGRPSFLQKRSKKLLLRSLLSRLVIPGGTRLLQMRGSKSFLVLFFKKGLLAFSSYARTGSLALALAAAGCMTRSAPVLSGHDQDDLARISRYLNAMQRFEAHFVQTGAYGPGAGLVWVDRPGQLRLDYQGPGARVMVITGGRVRILDRSNGALTTQPLSRTPLGILLAQEIHLDGDVTVDGLVRQGETLTVTLSKTGAGGQGSLALQMADHPLRLLGVAVTDPYHRTLELALSEIDTAPVVTPGLFAPPAMAPGS